MRVCTWGTGEQERGFVGYKPELLLINAGFIFHMFCAESSTIVSGRAHPTYFLVCSTLWTTYTDCDGLCDDGEEYKWDWTGVAIAGEAWSVEGFVDESLENVLRVFIKLGLRLYFLHRRLQAHRHCCLSWIFCVEWNMRDIEVLHG